jgi:hypothetical protein
MNQQSQTVLNDSHHCCVYSELKMQGVQSKHNFTISDINYMFRLLFCSHHQADPKNTYKKKGVFVFLYSWDRHDDGYKTVAETCS